MPEFCDVALPVPLDMVFTYRVAADAVPIVGGRVLVPFRQQRMTGIVLESHDRAPAAKKKNILSVLDSTPVLDQSLLRLGRWIADYYLAPIGEVFRTMLPLGAEFKRAAAYRITAEGRMALHLAGMSGSSARSRRSPDEQAAEFRVLDYLGSQNEDAESDSGTGVREQKLLSAAHVTRPILASMLRKKWISREDVSVVRDAVPTIKVAQLKSAEGKINQNQRIILDTLAASGGRVPVEMLRELEVPRTTLGGLIRRGLVEIIEEPVTSKISPGPRRPSLFNFEFNPAQQSALDHLREAVAAKKFSGMLLHGVTGSGKTAVYLAGMRSVLEAGRSAILLVPEIGLTPAVAADLHQIFGDQVAILHSALSDKERARQWHRIRNGETRMVVGTRSAVFAPVADLALIIVDEEHDASYKQEETPRYHARDVAVMRAKMANAAVVLGSATPSLESYFNATKNK
ncbi:MAG: DEAD/DEAH box helicase, partial [Candidatus Sulfotelmatobacter sp.]